MATPLELLGDLKMLVLEMNEDVVKKLPYLTVSWKIFFTAVNEKRKKKEKFLYMKHGVGFTTNLIELLKELKKGNISMIWYNFGIGGRVEIFVDKNGELAGRYLTPYSSTLDSFKKRLGIP
jgi:hypothetical protein